LGRCSLGVTFGVLAAVGALVLATAIGLWWRARNGKVVAKSAGTGGSAESAVRDGPDGRAGRAESLTAGELGAELGGRATLVQFSTAFCAPCRATRQILGEVATMVDGVTHVEIDAESRLDLVRRLDVRRTPTTFVLGPDGQVTHRASGQPRKADVIAALGAMIEFPI
jgi:thiol-disulfide isomerase/thioredoxin